MSRTLGDIKRPGETARPKPRRQNGAAIRSLREKDGWSQDALAKAAGLRQATLSVIETEYSNATVRTLNRIARQLRVPVAAIMRDYDGTTAAVTAIRPATRAEDTGDAA